MGTFGMVTIIVIATLISGLIREWIKTKKTPQVDLSPIEKRLATLENLQERIQVLEAIVTDKGYDLKRKINDL